jgi:hypothetical protein
VASGIERSKFIRPMADALGWTTGRLRALLQRSDYHAPYLDLQRALRILQANVPAQMPAVLKALNVDEALLREPEGNQQLALMPPAAEPAPEAPSGALIPHRPGRSGNGAKLTLVERLARAIPGEQPVEYKREKVRQILKKHNVDGRMKDEARAFAWVKKAFPEATLQQSGTAIAVEVVSDIDTLPPPRLRELVKSLMTKLAEKDRQLKHMKTQLGEVNYFLNATRVKMVGESGLHDVTEEQAFFFLASAAAKRVP